MRHVQKPKDLSAFIPAVTKRFTTPKHLAKFIEVFERIARGEQVHATVSMPPRHGKTELLKHGIAWLLLKRPDLQIGYATHGNKLAAKKAREIRAIYERGGGPISKEAAASTDFRTGIADGGLWSGGIGSAWTGEGFHVLVIDDPIRDRARAESGAERERLVEWMESVALPRMEPTGSPLVVHTRWTTQDLIAHLNQDESWEKLNYSAITEDGEALWPERFSLERLQRIQERVGPYAWASLYLGRPYARGGAVFVGDVTFYDALPVDGLRYRVGIDLAYSSSRRADYSVAVVLAEHAGITYVIEVLRRQTSITKFMAELQALCARYGSVTPFMWSGGQERGIVDLVRSQGFRINAVPATTDKFTRSQGVAAAWTAGKVLLPKEAPWLNDFVNEIVAFSGDGGGHDDQVDALAAAFHALADASDIVITAQQLEPALAHFPKEARDRYSMVLGSGVMIAVPIPKKGITLAAAVAWGAWEVRTPERWRDRWKLKPVLRRDGAETGQYTVDKDASGQPIPHESWPGDKMVLLLRELAVYSGDDVDAILQLGARGRSLGVHFLVSSSPLAFAAGLGGFKDGRIVTPGEPATSWIGQRFLHGGIRILPAFENPQINSDVRDALLSMRSTPTPQQQEGWAEVLRIAGECALKGHLSTPRMTIPKNHSDWDFERAFRPSSAPSPSLRHESMDPPRYGHN